MLRLVRIAVTGIAAVSCTLALATTASAAVRPPTPPKTHSGAAITGISQPGSQLQPAATGTFQIHNANAGGKCIGISYYLAGDWNCTTNPDQTWHWGNAIVPGWSELVNGNGQCLAVAGGSDKAATAIWGWNCVGSPDQYWKFFPNGDGTGRIVNYHGWIDPDAEAWVVGVWGGSTENGARLVLYWPDGTRNQDWF
jgi:hypothetical protein